MAITVGGDVAGKLKTPKLEAIRKADAEYMIELISRTEDRTIKAAFANRDQIRTFGVPWNPGTQVYNFAWKRVYLFLEQASPGDPTIALFRDVVDPRSPVYGLINPRGVPSSLFYNKDQNERVRF